MDIDMESTFKRKRDESQVETKKNRVLLNDKETEDSNQWPVYNHPEGGIVKVTPWGTIRKYIGSNGEEVTKFEDSNFHDISFQVKHTDHIYDMPVPSTPQSLYQSSIAGNSPMDRERIKLSPSDEAENYVLNGYDQSALQSKNENSKFQLQKQNNFQNSQQHPFSQEQEHYFGMMDQDHTDDE